MNEDKTTPASLSGTLRLYLRTLMEINGAQVLAAVFAMLLVSLTEGIGIALLLPLLQVAGFQVTQQGPAGRFAAIFQTLLQRSGIPPQMWLATLLLCFVLLIGVRSLLNRVQSVLSFAAVLRFELTLSRRLYQAILNANWLFLVRRRSADLTHALTADIIRVDTATFGLITMVSNLLASLLYVALALKLSAAMTLLVLGAGALLIFLTRGRTSAAHQTGSRVSTTRQELYAAATEHLQNLKTVKTFAAQENDVAMFSALQQRVSSQVLRNASSQAAAAFWFESGSLVVLGAVILVSLQWIRVQPAIVLLLLVIFTRLMPRIAAAYNQFHAFVSEIPAFQSIMDLQAECIAAAETPAAGTQMELRSRLDLENVTFAYTNTSRLVLDQLSLTIPAGKITAVIGSSGAGKSTLADLVNGLVQPNSGRVTLDGTGLTPALARAWRTNVGYVAQDTVLFHDTVRANLLWAKPDASEGEIIESLQLAAASFVLDLPRGLDTVVGDRGILFSNGQRQRIALARALLRKPSLLVLDEATNSLDLDSERHILNSIDQLKGKLTVLVIAHRYSAVERADLIYVVENGRIAASGDWPSLKDRLASFRLEA